MRRYLTIFYRAVMVILGLLLLPFVLIMTVDFIDVLLQLASGNPSEYIGGEVGLYLIAGTAMLFALGVQLIRKLF